MKTSLRKFRGFALNKQGPKERRDLRPFSQLDELAQAAQDMQDMRDCYDRLLSAAAATTNSAFEFSESLRELGDCLLEKTALNDDEESGKVLLMLGKVQYEVQKLIDSYRSHISHTITVPSESLLNELRIVEEMKRQCDEKREVYEDMKAKHREKGRSRSGRENFSTQQLIMAHDEYDQEATLFVFRLKSLKQGQSRSLLTQAARHHAAQLCFFKKALKSLEAVEPYVKLVTEQQHIDYHFVGLEDDDLDDYDDYNDDRDDDDDDGSYDSNDDGELSFDYGQNDQEQDVSTSRNSMEVDQVDLTFPKVAKVEDLKNNVNRLHRHNASFRARIVSQSAPLFAENKVDPSEKLRQMRPSFTRKFHSYVLPTPIDAKSAVSIGSGNPVKHTAITNLSGGKQNLWHSTPLEPKMYEKNSQVESIYVPKVIKVQSVLKESNNNIATRQLPPPLLDGHIFSRNDQVSASDSKKIKRQAFSGPLTSKPWSLNHPQLYSGPLLRNPVLQPSSSPPKASAGASPTFMSSPKISELHELPRPPTSSSFQSPRSTGLVGHSAPLVSRAQVQSSIKMVTKSPLPKPPQTVSRSLSIPSNDSRFVDLQVSKPMKVPLNSLIAEDLVSPPLSPLALSNN
ncbi:uncharacterized protein At2g33490 [Humulus lupulus]|uniref:uncharacterized protein At2g33490 n=1 Tax=Humulus lupulus TaxID=3486 RepID=UPI002B411A87|nr:uncharacterized protein At2g33490 [Humulus lupulus]XP_062110737.1 uncharacterized protein At2g33490 [Humulus lupulus]